MIVESCYEIFAAWLYIKIRWFEQFTEITDIQAILLQDGEDWVYRLELRYMCMIRRFEQFTEITEIQAILLQDGEDCEFIG
jgi:hypothetical protein